MTTHRHRPRHLRLSFLATALALSAACGNEEVLGPPFETLPSNSVVAGGGAWSTKAAMPTARGWSVSGVISGKLYVAGGIPTGGSATTANEAYDPITNAWMVKAATTISRSQAAGGVINDRLYVVGGCINSDCGSPTNALQVYDPVANSWSAGAAMPTARGLAASGVINSKLYVVGGARTGTDYATLEIYDPGTNTWATGAPMPTARQAAAAGVINGILYVIGGTRNGGATFTTLEAYNPVSNSWSTKAPIPTAQRFFMGSSVANNILYVIGGQGASGLLTTVAAYDPADDSWTTVASLATARQAAAVGLIDGVLYAAGGQTPSAIVGTNEAFAPPATLLPNPTTIPAVDQSVDHSCALRFDGMVVCWGRNDHGESTVPGGLTSVAQVSAGGYHTCALKTDGTVVCWGDNAFGQRSVPAGLSSVAQISTGVHHTCALRTVGTVTCWGWNAFGQSSVPGGLAPISEIKAGGYHTCALRANGTVTCWGRNSEGEASPPAGLASVVQIVGGNVHTCARTSGQTVTCWGAIGAGNDFGQTTVPAGLSSVAQVSASNGSYHTCARRTNGTVVCWGDNRDGAATPPAGLQPVLQVSAGSYATCAVETDGDVICWGSNPFGQINVPSGLNVLHNVSYQTPPGSNVNVTPVDQTTNAPSPLSVTFATVNAGGTTTVASNTVGGGGSPPAPGGFRLGTPATYYDIQTTATFSGTITICVSYSGVSYSNENQLQLLHYSGGIWSNVTTSLDMVNDRICGSSPSLSPFLVAQLNADPTARLSGPSSALEGSAVTFDAGASSDADNDIASYTWGFGDGSAPVTTASAQVQHTFINNRTAPFTVTVTVKDSYDAASSTSISVSVANLAPVLSSITTPADPVAIGVAASTSAQFTDAGIQDAHLATIDWGDGQSTAGSISENNGAGTVSGTHAYAQAGVYTVTVRVDDQEGGVHTAVSTSYIVAYDPNGGFVTGGGWIMSPAGAYTANPSLTGKANFGFVAKYENGASTPSGNTQFMFKEAGFTFASTSYDWLVVANAKAQYKGLGSVNGQGSYRFMLTVIDGDENGGGGIDRLRLRVWLENGGSVYDNQMDAPDDATPTTALGGGSIKIHKN